MHTVKRVACFVTCLMFLFAGMGYAVDKQTVAILDFESIGSEEYLGKAVAEIIRTELVETRKFRVVERAQIKKALSEQELQMSGAIDDESAVQIGKLLGADLIIVGSVVKIGTSYTINSRLIDVQTGEAQLGRNVTGNDLNLLTGMSRNLIEDLFGTKPKPVMQVPISPPAPVQPEPKATIAKPITPSVPQPPAQPLAQTRDVTWDFEDPDLPGWTRTGTAFDHQPTYGDNPTARRRGQPSKHQGDYWIGGYEKRPRPFDRPGATQGDGPQGTLTSAPFKIATPVISFLIGGGCDISKVRADLMIDGRVVRSATGSCNETMERKRWDVGKYMGTTASIRLVDESSGGWGHINFDDVKFEGTPISREGISTTSAGTTPTKAKTAITWNFEDPELPGWIKSGNAFDYQPTYGDNPTARRRGQPSMHRGEYWIGGYEKRPRPFDRPGATQGDGPRGTLTSKPFRISTSTISFLIGGGCDKNRVYVELIVDGRSVMKTTGKCTESMERTQWNVSQYYGRTALIRIVDDSSGGWGHINVDDFRFK